MHSGNLSVTKVPLSVLMWNVRGFNSEKKQRYYHWFIGEQRPDIVMLNETRLTSKLVLNGYHSHQTLLKRAGGCITFTNFKYHSKVKALGTYLNSGPRYRWAGRRSTSSTCTWNQGKKAPW